MLSLFNAFRIFRLNNVPCAGILSLHTCKRSYYISSPSALHSPLTTTSTIPTRYQTQPSSRMPEIIDDKSQFCIPFLLDRVKAHQARYGSDPPPLFLGLNGVQGAGKTVLVSLLYSQYACDFLYANAQGKTKLGLNPPKHPPLPTILPPRGHPLPRRYLPHPRRPSCAGAITSLQPTSPASRPAINPRSRPGRTGLRVSPRRPSHRHPAVRQVRICGTR